jgi:hypothetical protein
MPQAVRQEAATSLTSLVNAPALGLLRLPEAMLSFSLEDLGCHANLTLTGPCSCCGPRNPVGSTCMNRTTKEIKSLDAEEPILSPALLVKSLRYSVRLTLHIPDHPSGPGREEVSQRQEKTCNQNSSHLRRCDEVAAC